MALTPYRGQGVGVPSSASETLTTGDKALLAGDNPSLLTFDYAVAADQDFADLTVVGFDDNGRIVPAEYDATYAEDGVRPIGIAVAGIESQSSTAYEGLSVYRAGCFNIDAIVWPASFDTDAKKFGAFEGAPTPTNILVRRIAQATFS